MRSSLSTTIFGQVRMTNPERPLAQSKEKCRWSQRLSREEGKSSYAEFGQHSDREDNRRICTAFPGRVLMSKYLHDISWKAEDGARIRPRILSVPPATAFPDRAKTVRPAERRNRRALFQRVCGMISARTLDQSRSCTFSQFSARMTSPVKRS